METRKINAMNTMTLTYEFANDERVTLRAGEKGVTEMDIKTVKLLVNNEVNNNLKNAGPALTEKEKKEIDAYKKNHPGEVLGRKWNASIDSFTDEEGVSFADAVAMSNPFQPADAALEDKKLVIEEAMNHLTKEQRQIILWKFFEEKPQKEIAEALGISSSAVSQRIRTILKEMKHFIENFSF